MSDGEVLVDLAQENVSVQQLKSLLAQVIYGLGCVVYKDTSGINTTYRMAPGTALSAVMLNVENPTPAPASQG